MKNIFRRKNKKDAASPNPPPTKEFQISGPFDVKLEHHVDFDHEFGLSGVPKDWDLSQLSGISYTVDDVNESNVSPISLNNSTNVDLDDAAATLDTSNLQQQTNGALSPSLSTTSVEANPRASSSFFMKLRGRAKTMTASTPLDGSNESSPSGLSAGNGEHNLEKTGQHSNNSSSSSFFSKIFTKNQQNKASSPTTKEGQQFTMSFSNMKRTEAGYYVEVNSNNSSTIGTGDKSKFKKDKVLIDLISDQNPFRIFTKMKKIGTGSTADVYKAIHVPSGKKVAIKVMPMMTNKNTNFDMIENEIFMMHHACQSYANIFDYDHNSDRTLMVQYFGTYTTVNCTIHDHTQRYLAASKRKNYESNQEGGQEEKTKDESKKTTSTAVSPRNPKNGTFTPDIETLMEYEQKSHDELWVVMEFVSGGKLTDLLHVKFMESEIAAILQPILKCLHLLHTEYGVIHRDIKSDNVLITRDGKIKLADFGFCAENTGRRRSVVGTPYWMCPECVSGAEYNEKADVWSLGILTLELANGEVPLIEHTPIQALFMIRSQEPPTFNSSSEWSDSFHNFLGRCLVKDPEQRASVQELLEHPFIKNACNLDFLEPVLSKIRAEKRKKHFKESEIGLQVIKLRNDSDEEDEEYAEKKKAGTGIMGVTTSFAELQQSSNQEDGDNEYGGDYAYDDEMLV